MSRSFKSSDHRPWAGPLPGETPALTLPVNDVLAESSNAVIRVLEVRRYSAGIAIEVDVTATTGEKSPHDIFASGMEGSGEEPGPAVLRFGVRLANETTASTIDHVLTPSTAPVSPYLATLGGPGFGISGHRLHAQQVLWLWPMPEPAMFELIADWPQFGIAAANISIRLPANDPA